MGLGATMGKSQCTFYVSHATATLLNNPPPSRHHGLHNNENPGMKWSKLSQPENKTTSIYAMLSPISSIASRLPFPFTPAPHDHIVAAPQTFQSANPNIKQPVPLRTSFSQTAGSLSSIPSPSTLPASPIHHSSLHTALSYQPSHQRSFSPLPPQT
ncbi:hypothetical protein E2C01_001513 [Portunus trituberculatus]|uniref:Uncharacterized protein n=1 Tax=Portunus trituberculatus TaxID=210409 RepID=A0A5B7CKM0_PORTR|nr:hypothetical protein [Portunus trituberculatus]